MTEYPTLSFCIPGEPVPKGRPRFARRGRGFRVYTDEKSREFEQAVAAAARRAADDLGGWQVGARVPLRLEVQVVCKRPASRFRVADDDGQRTAKTTRPDLDNYLKSLIDGLQGARLFADDAQIVEIAARKAWGKILNRRERAAEGAFCWVSLSVVPVL